MISIFSVIVALIFIPILVPITKNWLTSR
jgi:hypothetical protein